MWFFTQKFKTIRLGKILYFYEQFIQHRKTVHKRGKT